MFIKMYVHIDVDMNVNTIGHMNVPINVHTNGTNIDIKVTCKMNIIMTSI